MRNQGSREDNKERSRDNEGECRVDTVTVADWGKLLKPKRSHWSGLA